MADVQIKFDDGAAYERMMGVWSRTAGTAFIDWLGAAKGLRWVDIGCGNGAFTELILAKSAPSSVCAIDPSDASCDGTAETIRKAGRAFDRRCRGPSQ